MLEASQSLGVSSVAEVSAEHVDESHQPISDVVVGLVGSHRCDDSKSSDKLERNVKYVTSVSKNPIHLFTYCVWVEIPCGYELPQEPHQTLLPVLKLSPL